MSTVIDADGTTFTFDGIEVGGITQYTLVDGVTPDVPHFRVDGEREYFPGVAEYGQFRMTLYRDPSDPGQSAMETARANRERKTCVVTLKNGTSQSFLGYVKQLPLLGGGINGVNSVQVSLKVAGVVE